MNKILTALLASSLIVLAGLSQATADDHAKANGNRAIAVITPTSAKEAPKAERIGVVFFEQLEKGVRIVGYVKGLAPNGEHGFHVHQYGDLSSSDGLSSAGHFNPHNMPHASPEAEEHHSGDLGNLRADSNGVARIDIVADWMTLSEGPDAILGRTLVVHAEPDDLVSQPTGDSGARIGVGVIGWANPESGFQN